MTSEEFRTLALSLPEAAESAHMGHPDFRVRNKIFATLTPGEQRGMVKLKPDQQQMLVAAEPAMFAPVPGGWGVRGATHVDLQCADRATVLSALQMAWGNIAPPSLAAVFSK